MTILADSCLISEIVKDGNPSSEPLSPIASIEKPKKTVSECFYAHKGRRVDKWSHYLDIYEKHFAKYVGTSVGILEIGVDHGGSLQLWKEYFGPKAYITGIDIDPRCAQYQEDRIKVLTLDQANLPSGLHFDIVIDDGSHIPEDQEASFKALWPSTGGVYLIEDCHSGYPRIEPPKQPQGLITCYHWVMVIERPERLIRGTPSRPLRQDEIDAQHLYSDV